MKINGMKSYFAMKMTRDADRIDVGEMGKEFYVPSRKKYAQSIERIFNRTVIWQNRIR